MRFFVTLICAGQAGALIGMLTVLGAGLPPTRPTWVTAWDAAFSIVILVWGSGLLSKK